MITVNRYQSLQLIAIRPLLFGNDNCAWQSQFLFFNLPQVIIILNF